MPDAGRRTLPRALIRRAALAALLAVLLLAVTPAVVLTQDAFGLDGEGLGSSAGIAGGWDWVGLVLRLGLVLVAIWAVVVAMRWYLRRSGGAIGGGGRRGHLEVLEIRALGGQRSLQLVRLGERAVLLGVTPERISALLEVADPDELAQLTAPPEADAPGRPFSSFLAGMGGSMLAARRAARERVFGAGGEDAAPLPAAPRAGARPRPPTRACASSISSARSRSRRAPR